MTLQFLPALIRLRKAICENSEGQVFRRSLCRWLALLLFLIGSGALSLHAQSIRNRVALGLNAGISKYWGEFTDNQFGFSTMLDLRYNAIPVLQDWIGDSSGTLAGGSIVPFIGAYLEMARFQFKITDRKMRDYSDYFPDPALRLRTYPDGKTGLEPENATRLFAKGFLLGMTFFASETNNIFVYTGIEHLEWNAATASGNETLPNKAADRYKANDFSLSFGAGIELYLTPNMSVRVGAHARPWADDFIDDYRARGDNQSSNDAYATLNVGLSWYFGQSDYDGDGLSNETEAQIGTNPKERDTDGDHLEDKVEYDNNFNPLTPDTDGDGLNDSFEFRSGGWTNILAGRKRERADARQPILISTDTINDARCLNALIDDTDGDGLSDYDEVYIHLTNPLSKDSDGDKLSDAEEINPTALLQGRLIGRPGNLSALNYDSDNDKLSDFDELYVYYTDPTSSDTDLDSLSDLFELQQSGRWDARKANVSELRRVIRDADSLPVVLRAPRLLSPLKADSDGDGLSDYEEFLTLGTDPTHIDRDGDQLTDFEECRPQESARMLVAMEAGLLQRNDTLDPRNNDSDSDGLPDGMELFETGSKPTNADSDADGLQDSVEWHLQNLTAASKRMWWSGANRVWAHRFFNRRELCRFDRSDSSRVYQFRFLAINDDSSVARVKVTRLAWHCNCKDAMQFSAHYVSSVEIEETPSIAFTRYKEIAADGLELISFVPLAKPARSGLRELDPSDQFIVYVRLLHHALPHRLSLTDHDSDSDGVDDLSELLRGSDPTSGDSDNDGLTDGFEYQRRLRLVNSDTDNDSLSDYQELYPRRDSDLGRYMKTGKAGTQFNPRDCDCDGDQLLDGQEVYRYGTNPLDSVKRKSIKPSGDCGETMNIAFCGGSGKTTAAASSSPMPSAAISVDTTVSTTLQQLGDLQKRLAECSSVTLVLEVVDPDEKAARMKAQQLGSYLRRKAGKSVNHRLYVYGISRPTTEKSTPVNEVLICYINSCK